MEGHTERQEVICLENIANFSGLPEYKFPLWEPWYALGILIVNLQCILEINLKYTPILFTS